MHQSKCPVCGCKTFYVKNPEDEYDVHEFECREGEVRFSENTEPDECPSVDEKTETYCNDCAWHDKFEKIK